MIFAGAGVLLSVTLVLDHTYWVYSEIELAQTAKDVIVSRTYKRQELIDDFERIENFFRRLEGYAKVPMTETMKHIMVMIIVEVLRIFGNMASTMPRGLIPNAMLLIADIDSFKGIIRIYRRRNIEDALRNLDRLTQEAQMAITQIPKVAHNVKGGVEIVGDQVKGVSDQVKDLGDQVKDVGSQVMGVRDRVQDFGDQIIGLDDKVKVVGDLDIEGMAGQTCHLILFLYFLFSFFFLGSIFVRPGA